jgi:hypothetical protein
MNLTLVRWAYGRAFTLGTLYGDGLTLATLERPWVPDPDNPLLAGEPHQSCVPDGEYVLRPHISEKYPADRHAYSLENPDLGVYYTQPIPAGQKFGRDAVLIHNANYVRQLEGCIAVGLHHNYTVEPTVQESVTAMRMLRAALGRAQHRVLIRPITGTKEVLR